MAANPSTGRYRFSDGTGGIAGRTGEIYRNKKPVLPPDVVFLDSFYAQCVASQLGLPDLNTDLTHFAMTYIQPAGRYVPEIADVWPGTTYMATAAAVHIGRKTGDRALIAKALKMSEAVANQIFDEGGATTKGYAFGTPESWFVDDVTISRYTAYSRARSIWQLLDALDPLPGRTR
jgi:non-lysosomal glucosylceramidase